MSVNILLVILFGIKLFVFFKSCLVFSCGWLGLLALFCGFSLSAEETLSVLL